MARFEYISGTGGFETPEERARVRKKLEKLRAEFDAGGSQSKAVKNKSDAQRTIETRDDHKPALRAELQRIQAEYEAEKARTAEVHARELAAAHAAREAADFKYTDQQRRLNTRLTDPRVFERAAKLKDLENAKTRAIVRTDLISDDRATGEHTITASDAVITRFPSAEKDDEPGVLRDTVAGGWGERWYKQFMSWVRTGK